MITASKKVATGYSYGALVDDQHAYHAVKNALAKMPSMTVGSVFLFLTSGYAHHPQTAIKLAATAAGTPMIHGACAVSIFTEEEWLFDVEGAVAMVFPPDYCWQPLGVARHNETLPRNLLCLSSPNAAKIAINSTATAQFGSIVSDVYGHGPFSLWQSGRIVEQEYFHAALLNNKRAPDADTNQVTIGRAPAVRAISPALQINLSSGNQLIEVGQEAASDSLAAGLPDNLINVATGSTTNLFAAIANKPGVATLSSGDYTLQSIIEIDQQSKRITLTGDAKAGRYLFWAVRDRKHAQQAMRDELTAAKSDASADPQFALLFPNLSRGADFYQGRDRDVEIFTELFPQLPLIGLYGHGEIINTQSDNQIHHYSTVFAIFT